jgi:universal stress protein E
MTQTAVLELDAPALARASHHGGPVVAAVTGENGVGVLRAAALLAAHLGSTLRVLAVVEPSPWYFASADTGPIALPDEEQERRAELLARVQQETRDALGGETAASVEVRYGDPARATTAAAREWGAAVIVVGLGRQLPVDRLLGAETALRIVRLADRPVLAVAGPLDTLPRHVVVATDFSPSSVRAAELALPLVAERASITFVHAWERSGITSASLQASEAAYAASLPASLARLVDAIDAPAGLHVHAVAREGRVAEQVLRHAQGDAGTLPADLLVVGRRTRSWFERLLVGSVTTAVLRGAACAVLITPDPDAVEKDRLRRTVTGLSESSQPAEWIAQLDGFSRRNEGRPVVLEEDAPDFGAQLVASGLRLLGATYDRHDRRVELMLGDGAAGGRRLTHSIGDVHAVAILTSEHARDTALSVRHGAGQSLLTFAADARAS